MAASSLPQSGPNAQYPFPNSPSRLISPGAAPFGQCVAQKGLVGSTVGGFRPQEREIPSSDPEIAFLRATGQQREAVLDLVARQDLVAGAP
jgi:hypothetical protein